jgi:hypothetical protein
VPHIEISDIANKTYFIESRGIRGGEKGDRAPTKTPPLVRMPVRNPATKKFDIDVEVMKRAAARQGIKPDDWRNVRAIPVVLMSDKVIGSDGVIFLERALFIGPSRSCHSEFGQAMSKRTVDVQAFAKSKKILQLAEEATEECNKACPMWTKPGVKSECSWRAIVSVQLLDAQSYPSRAVHRTKSSYSIRAMISSLQAISNVTGGVLAGIPLLFRQHTIDVKAAVDGKIRRIPIMSFEFQGSVSELRRLAVEELRSREQMYAALSGQFPSVTLKAAVDAEPDEDGLVAAVDDDDSAVDGFEADDSGGEELSNRIQKMARTLGYTAARMRLLEQKHEGDMQQMLEDLKAESGVKPSEAAKVEGDEWSPGDAGEENDVDSDDFHF